MGFYINPQNQSKEAFLKQHGRRIKPSEAMDIIKGGAEMPVCLIDNYAFKAAAIGHKPDEVEYFLRNNSGRPMEWWAVPNEKIYEVEPALAPAA